MAASPPVAAKPPDYYTHSRADLIAALPAPLGRVLDVGCGAGQASGPLRARGAEAIAGIELEPEPAARAAELYDEVLTGRAEEQVAQLSTGPFDTILCYDVLEHLADPAALLRRLHGVAAPGARLHVSVPNARHFSLVRDLVLRGSFSYTDSGHRDRTHLTWFTPRDVEAELTATGWLVEPRSHPALRARALHRLTRGAIAQFTFNQWVVLARRA